MNKIILTGRLTNDIETRVNANGNTYVNFGLAVSRDKNTTDFINCNAWNGTAVLLNQYCVKGDMIGIEGRLQSSSYEKDGVKQTRHSVLVERIEFLRKKNQPTTETQVQEDYEDIVLDNTIEDDDLPF